MLHRNLFGFWQAYHGLEPPNEGMWPLISFPDRDQFSKANPLQRQERVSVEKEELWAMSVHINSHAGALLRRQPRRQRYQYCCIEETGLHHEGQWGKLRDIASSVLHGSHR